MTATHTYSNIETTATVVSPRSNAPRRPRGFGARVIQASQRTSPSFSTNPVNILVRIGPRCVGLRSQDQEQSGAREGKR